MDTRAKATDKPRPRTTLWAAIVLLLMTGVGSGARPPTTKELLADVQRWLDDTHDLRARFEQVLLSGALGAGLEESGRVYVARPGRMRWDYLVPEFKVALVDGDRTRLYLAEDRQLWESSLSDADSLLPALLAGARPLAEAFEAQLDVGSSPEREGVWRLRLTPRAAADSVQEVVLVLRDPPRVSLEEIEVLDAAGNRLLYRFLDLERNRGLPVGAFEFEPPPGTEIVSH